MIIPLIATIAMLPLNEVPAARFERLNKGINLSHWWAQGPNYTLDRLRAHMTPEDFEQIRRSGFRHVRLTLEPMAIWDGAAPVKLRPDHIRLLKNDIGEIREAGLAVIVNAHPSDDFKEPLAKDDAAVDRFVAYWTALAGELRDTDPNWVFVEVLNEPVMEDANRWNAIQGRCIEAIRKVLPRHTLIAGGARWSALDQLQKVTIYPDRNIVYNFHSYEPFIFTHQGATWGWDMSRHFRDLPFPSDPASVARVLPKIEYEPARGPVRSYGEDRWNAQKLEAFLRPAAEWARKNNVRVTCNEFGAYRLVTPPESRANYLRAATQAFERLGIGWAMWDYAGGFSAFSGNPGQRRADDATLKALGLQR